MKSEKSTSIAIRIARSCKARTTSALRHVLLRSIEITPAPWKYCLRNAAFKTLPGLFRGNVSYEQWRHAYAYFISEPPRHIELVNLNKIPIPYELPAKKIAVQAHIFYYDLATELATLLASFPKRYDLLISTPHKQEERLLRKQFESLPNLENLQILVTPNRGRDLGPMLVGFGQKLLEYDYFAHVHTKKSAATNSIGDQWREYLWGGLLGASNHRILKILGLLEKHGLVYPQKFPLIDVQNCQWGDNIETAKTLCTAMGLEEPIPGYLEFPVGSMFWANTLALKPLLEKPFVLEDFELELGQTDNTIMHTIERLLSYISLEQGYPIAVLQNPNQISYYP